MTEEQASINKRFDKLENLIIKKDCNDPTKALKNLDDRFNKLEESIEPIIIWFGHMNWMKTGIVYTAGFIVTIGSAVFTIKSFFK